MTLPYEIPRCLGHGAGPTGHQLRADCVNCQRRTAPRVDVHQFMKPPEEYPCPERIAPIQSEAAALSAERT